MREWYKIQAKADAPTVAELHIFGEIGASFWNDDAVTAAQFVADLKALPATVKTIKVLVNSPGGSAFDGITIANALRAEREEHGRVVDVSVLGLAASAATIITSAGQPIRIADNATMMIHRPHAITMGEADAHRKMADALDKIESAIIATYRWVSKKSADELARMMAETTWLTAQDAVDAGLATEIIEPVKASAVFEPRAIKALGAVPLRIAASVLPWVRQVAAAPVPAGAAAARDVLRLCREAECSDLAEGFVTSGATLEAVQARLNTESKARADEKERCQLITAVCERFGVPMLSASYIAGGMKFEQVKAQIVTMRAIADGHMQIDTSLNPGGPMAQTIDVHAGYDALNGKTGRRA